MRAPNAKHTRHRLRLERSAKWNLARLLRDAIAGIRGLETEAAARERKIYELERTVRLQSAELKEKRKLMRRVIRAGAVRQPASHDLVRLNLDVDASQIIDCPDLWSFSFQELVRATAATVRKHNHTETNEPT